MARNQSGTGILAKRKSDCSYEASKAVVALASSIATELVNGRSYVRLLIGVLRFPLSKYARVTLNNTPFSQNS